MTKILPRFLQHTLDYLEIRRRADRLKTRAFRSSEFSLASVTRVIVGQSLTYFTFITFHTGRADILVVYVDFTKRCGERLVVLKRATLAVCSGVVMIRRWSWWLARDAIPPACTKRLTEEGRRRTDQMT